MKKVLLVSGSLPPIKCGVGYYSARLSREMAAAGLEFELLSTSGVNKPAAARLRTVADWKIRRLPKILDEIGQSQAHIIHIEYPAVGYRRQLGINLLPYALRLFKPRLKIVITLHEYHQSRWIGRLRNRITVFPAHRVVVSNQADVLALHSLARKLSLIPIGANFDVAPRRPDFFKRLLKKCLLSADRKTIIFFGHAYPNKQLEIVLDAFSRPELDKFQLLIFPELDGQSVYHRLLKQKIDGLNSRGTMRVGIHGFLNDTDASAVLQEGEYFILPVKQPISAKSGTAIAAVENGLVLVAHGSDRPEESAPFEHLKNCFLVSQVSPDSIAAAIGQLEASPAEVAAIKRGAKKLGSYFSWPSIVKKHHKMYAEL